MEVTLTCSECGSAVSVYPSPRTSRAACDVCGRETPVRFSSRHEEGFLEDCPTCERKDFYRQKDFNRKLGVSLFVIAAIMSIWTYGLSLVALWLLDLFLFRRLGSVAVCYNCRSIFRKVQWMEKIPEFDHETHDRIVYGGEDFGGKPLGEGHS